MSREERIQYLENERVLLWQKITELEFLLDRKTSDYESDAKLSSEQASAYKDLSEQANTYISETVTYVNTFAENIKTTYESVIEIEAHTKALTDEALKNSENIFRLNTEVVGKANEIQTKTAEIDKIFDRKPLIDENIIKLEGVFTKADDTDSKISVAFKSIQEKKKEIDQIHYEIFGYVEEGTNGEEIEVEGLKDKLEKSYTQISQKLIELENQLTKLKSKTESDFNNFIDNSNIEFASNTTQWKTEYTSILLKIQGLLPNAMTAGLSHAYYQKRRIEVLESRTLKKSFYYGIIGLIIVSLIPFAVSITLLIKDAKLEDVILKIPRMVLAILPLYIPVMWVAYSSNRKLNLSKRLIEEYSHKETLSKTFEGLSQQINDIDDKDTSNDLKVKLLYNILEVNSENPGKLISDYDKSDHPLMDALDKSIKLTNAVTKLTNIPGFTKLASTIEKKSQKLIEEQKRKVEAGIESIED